MAVKRLIKNTWHKVVAPAGNTVYIQTPRATGLLLQYGATAPNASDLDGLWFDKTITLNAGLTAWIRPSLSCNLFVTDTAGADPMTDTGAPLGIQTDLTPTKTAAELEDVTLTVAGKGGTTPYTYAWYYQVQQNSPATLIDSTINPTAATASLTINAATAESSGVYYCVIADATGDTIASTHCTLIVT